MKKMSDTLKKWITWCLFLLCTGCTLALTNCSNIQSDEFTNVELHGLRFRIPNRYFEMPYNENYLHHTALAIPIDELSVIPKNAGFGNHVSVVLMLNNLTFSQDMARVINIFKTTDRKTKLEKGMVVLFDSNKTGTGPWNGTDILYPVTGEQVYFECAKRWIDSSGNAIETLCTARVGFDQKNTAPRIELSYDVPRKDIDHWKEIDAQVRIFINRFAVK